jgi:FkbM family methyltransferase
MVREIYPGVAIHLIEAQPACLPRLEQVAAANGFRLHPCAIGSPEDAAKGYVTFSATDVASTGAHVAAQGEVGDGTVQVPVRTLDTLLSGQLSVGDRAFLKMDLQGYELAALKGATEILPMIEVIQTEVSFFAQAYEPPVVELLTFLDRAGFDLFDVAALAGRTRDNRLRQGDFIFVRRGAPLAADTSWA